MRTTKRALPVWMPVVLSGLMGVGGMMIAIRPAHREMATLTAELSQLESRRAQAAARIEAAARVRRGLLPVSATEAQALWPRILHSAAHHGYRVELLSFGARSVQDPSSGAVPTLEITLRLSGPYLALDDTLTAIREAIPLWAWRQLEISTQADQASLQVMAIGVIPLSGPAGLLRPARPQPAPGGTVPALPPPPSPPGQREVPR